MGVRIALFERPAHVAAFASRFVRGIASDLERKNSPMFGVLSYFRHIFHLLHHWLKVIESMSSEDQSGFVRFAWGRSRLPPKAFWRVNMKLLRSNMSEESLPVSSLSYSCGDLVLTDGAHQ